MGPVTDYLRHTIIKQVADHGVVDWYDPDGHYTAVADTLNISNTAVARYEDNFFALRHRVEPLLERFDPPRLVVYVPLDQADTHHALAELDAIAEKGGDVAGHTPHCFVRSRSEAAGKFILPPSSFILRQRSLVPVGHPPSPHGAALPSLRFRPHRASHRSGKIDRPGQGSLYGSRLQTGPDLPEPVPAGRLRLAGLLRQVETAEFAEVCPVAG